MSEVLNPVEESPEDESRKVAKIKEILDRGPALSRRSGLSGTGYRNPSTPQQRQP